MPIKMESQTLTIGELFTSSNVFRMPAFQRPYSWGEEEAAQLLDDVATAHIDASNNNGERSYYFLGQLIVSRRTPSSPYEVVDGQQRLVTLSAILAVLRDLLPPGSFRDDLQSYIRRPENAARQLLRTPRVALRPLDQAEYDRWITEPEGTAAVPAMGETDATTRLATTIQRIKNDIGTPRQEYISGFASYILNHCYIVMVTAQSAHDAYILFRSINARGQPLTDLDVVRGEFIRPFQDDSAESMRLAEAWDAIEDELGVDQLSVYLKTVIALVLPSSEHLELKDSVKAVLKHPSKSGIFISTLKSFIEVFDLLDGCELEFGEASERINRIVSCVKALPFDDWRPAALLWLAQKPTPSSKATLEFFKALDALGLGLLILGATSNTIAKRFRLVVEHVIGQTVLTEPARALFFTDAEKEKIKYRLTNPIANNCRFVRPLLLRLNVEMLDNQIPTYFPANVTLEHVLPQKPGPRSIWRQQFPDNKRRIELSQLLGNFAILSGSANPRASNFDFHKKREKIFGLRDSNVFPLTAELTNYDNWTEEYILRRHKQLNKLACGIMNL
jgi:hypothetical protein